MYLKPYLKPYLLSVVYIARIYIIIIKKISVLNLITTLRWLEILIEVIKMYRNVFIINIVNPVAHEMQYLA